MEKYFRGRRFTFGGRRSTSVIKIAQMQGNLMELVGSNPESRNWKGIVISLAVILAVCGLVVLSIILLTPENDFHIESNVNVSDVILKQWEVPNSVWRASSVYFTDENENVVMMSSPDDIPTVLIPRKVLRENAITDYILSANGKKALLIYDKVQIYSLSYNASYYIYNTQTGSKKQFIHEKSVNVFQAVEFGPVENSFIFSLNGDLYYRKHYDSNTEKITRGGKIGTRHNGIADWLYEEEILKTSTAFWWSPTGQYLAYASFDDMHVENSYVTTYEDGSLYNVLPYRKALKYKYPKVGRSIPVVNIHSINMNSNSFKQVTFIKPIQHGQRLEIFHSLTWLSDDELVITWSNRTETSRVIQQCFPTMSTCVDNIIQHTFTESIENDYSKTGWITNLNQKVLTTGNPNVFFLVLPSKHGGMGEFKHLAIVNKTSKPSTKRFLTSGNWEVTKVLHYDITNQEVYYVGNELNPGTRHVYRVNLDGKRYCVTCFLNLVNEEGRKTSCSYFDASFGTSSEWFWARCLGPGVPFSVIVETFRNGSASRGRIVRPPSPSMKNLLNPLTRFNTVWKDNFPIRTKMLIPSKSFIGKRPVVFFKNDVGDQNVDLQFRVDLASYVVKSIGAVAVFVDGRVDSLDNKLYHSTIDAFWTKCSNREQNICSGSNGNKLLRSVIGIPGVLEIEDMKTVIDLLKSEEEIDVGNIGVVGESGYGGYTAALALTHPQFKCGVARSPITNWSHYVSYGAEKIIGSASANSALYDKSNLLHRINEFSNSKLKIFHGLQDRKVNMQHSVLLEEAAMLSRLPPDTISVTYLPSDISNKYEMMKIESNVYESISLFLAECLFDSSSEG